MKINKKLLFFPALSVGIIGLVAAINLKPDLPTKPAGDRARLVETVSLEQQRMAPLAVGFGKVVPKLEWKAIAEVTGQIVYRHPDLEKGQVIPAGTVVLKVDPLDYELKLIQAEADLKSSQISLAKLNQEEENLNQTLKIEKNRLVISNKELQRKQDLRKKGLNSQSDVDLQQQSALSQQKLVLDIANQIILIPDEKRVAQAVVKVNESKVKEAQRALDKTTITLPKAMRISLVDVEENQVVNLQQEMFIAHGIDVMEVEAQLSIHDMQTLASSFSQFSRDAAGIPTPNQAPIKASIQLNSGSLNVSWPAKVARISETVDENQATAGIILEIVQDYSQLQPDSATPLVNGMFVKAEIEGVANLSWVVPERALHGDKVYLMDDSQRLQVVKVEVLYRRDNQVVVSGELHTGDKLVLNDVLPAIEGMLLKESNSKEAELGSDTQETAS
ncbi:HlyD family secretion protein [uncultured Vibrio sp.]|uniref:efflux RND transporter periplasmic adaptor subunit n=1 Tax=uncultured Vibrio sp. TaxID=114054 RepID=UPI002616F0C1|nr:HlyD family secretion protein [uncultured Vibrio sp.]